MQLYVNVKQLGKRKQSIEKQPIQIETKPATTGELITAVVIEQVKEYNNRLAESELLKYLTAEEIQEKSVSGKIAFGVNYNELPAEAGRAVENALLSFEDGIFRVFVGETELQSLQEQIELSENEELTFVRLTMLAGRMW